MKANGKAAKAAASAAEQVTVSQVKAPEYRDGYANSVDVQISVWDFRLTFGKTAQAGNELVVSLFQSVTVSPQQAKALAMVLAQNIAQYERTFGPINIEAQAAPAVQPAGGLARTQ